MASDGTVGTHGTERDRWDAQLYDARHSFVWRYGTDLVDVLAPRAGERILDVGCGTGHLTARIAAAGAEVVGIDSAPEMIRQARRSYPELRFEVADGADFSFAEPFDAVFSNAAIHWMRLPTRVVACISRALKPGGRFVAEFGGKGNVQAIVTAICDALETVGVRRGWTLNPWYFPSIGQYATVLERQRLVVTQAALFARPTPLDDGEEGLRNWLAMFAGSFLAAVPPERRADVIRDVEARLRPQLWRNGVWVADYVRLRVVAVRDR